MSFDQDLPPMFCVNPKSPFGKTLTPRQIHLQINEKKKHYQSITPKKTFNSPNSPRSNLRVGFTRSPVRSPPSSPGRNNSILRSTQQQQPTPNRRTPQSRTLKSLWITVYGFEATTMGSDVLTLFENFGDVVDHRAGLKNSIDLMYSTKEEAEYALAQDGLRVNIGADKTTCIMIGKYSKRRRSNVAVIIDRTVFITPFLFYCLLLNHSFHTNPNKITNYFKHFFLLQLYNYIAPASLF